MPSISSCFFLLNLNGICQAGSGPRLGIIPFGMELKVTFGRCCGLEEQAVHVSMHAFESGESQEPSAQAETLIAASQSVGLGSGTALL